MIASKRFKVLLIMEQCNPEWASVPLVGYRFFDEIRKLVDVTLVTHERNKPALEKVRGTTDIAYMPEADLSKRYHKVISDLVYKGRVIWPLYHALAYPIYAEFNRNVYKNFARQILEGKYDLVHVLTPMMPRYPVEVIKVCKTVPFLLGPVNGGVPFPPGFQEKAKKEYAGFNFLRAIGRWLIPGYVETYKNADKILSGSTYTLNLVKEMFALPENKISLLYENGVLDSFFSDEKAKPNSTVNLLFVGRLVPYKCADILLEAIASLDHSLKERLKLTIVGDGSEKEPLQQRTQELGLDTTVQFTGWVSQEEILQYYREADVFCFPSIREFGGAVVLEAMACGLPCIVANNGGIGEYVTEETGFKIEPLSREYLTQEMASKIKLLAQDENLRLQMSAKSVDRAREFTWSNKAKKVVEIYEEMLPKQESVSMLSEQAQIH